MDSIKKLAMRMKLRKIDGTVVHHCALVCRLLEKDGTKAHIVKGFCVSPGDLCEHYWVRTDDEGLDMDIGMELACLYSPELRTLQTMLLEEVPETLRNIEIKKQDDNERLFELYTSDPRSFWNETPLSVRTFH